MSHFIDFSILHLSLSSIVRFPPSSYHVPPKEKVESVSFSDPRDFTKDFRVIRPVNNKRHPLPRNALDALQDTIMIFDLQ